MSKIPNGERQHVDDLRSSDGSCQDGNVLNRSMVAIRQICVSASTVCELLPGQKSSQPEKKDNRSTMDAHVLVSVWLSHKRTVESSDPEQRQFMSAKKINYDDDRASIMTPELRTRAQQAGESHRRLSGQWFMR